MSDYEGRIAKLDARDGGWMVKLDAHERQNPTISIDDYLSWFQWGGLTYPFLQAQSLGQRQEWPNPTFEGYVQGMYRNNGVVFACILRRLLVFSDIRFQWQRVSDFGGGSSAGPASDIASSLRAAGYDEVLIEVVASALRGRPGRLFGNQELSVLEHPWTSGTTGDLAARAIQDADLGGGFYVTRRGIGAAQAKRLGTQSTDNLFRLRPDWVTVVAGSDVEPSPDDPMLWDADSELLGYIYEPLGPHSTAEPEFYMPDEVAAWTPIPDPAFRFRGMSWLTPVLREVIGDNAAMQHKLSYFEHGATPNLVVSVGQNMSPERFDKWVAKMEASHAGASNAYRTLYLGVGSDAKVIGNSMEQIDFKAVQGHGETRIAAAAGVPAVLAGLSEGLASATYSNYSQARHAFGDMTIRPLWRNFCGSLESIMKVPSGSRLWYDDRDIPFLREDGKDLALIEQTEAATIGSLIQAGYKPDTVVDAVMNHDWTRLVHTGLYSVQLMPLQMSDLPLPPGKEPPPPPGKAAPPTTPAPVGAPPANGQKPKPAPPPPPTKGGK